MAVDIRNVKRGSCNHCKSCTNYVSMSGKVLCDYCGCPPAKHDQVDDESEKESEEASPRPESDASDKESGKGRCNRVPLAHRGRVVYNSRVFVRSGTRSSSGNGSGGEQRVRSRTPETRSPTEEAGSNKRSASRTAVVSRSSSESGLCLPFKKRMIPEWPKECLRAPDQLPQGFRPRSPMNHEASVAKVSKKQRAATPTSRGGGGPGSANPQVDEFAIHARRKPAKLSYLLDMPPPSVEIQEKNAWNPHDRSYNIFVKESDCFTFHRHPVAQSTDAIRGKVCYERGLHLFEFTWPSRQRGTHARVGVCTADAPVHSVGYHGLMGDNEHSWGWDLVYTQTHNGNSRPGRTFNHKYPVGAIDDFSIDVPDKFILVLNMDEGVVGFMVKGHYLGNAFWGLQGQKLFVTASAVWGHCEVSMKYLGGLDAGPVPLTHLCRRLIRKTLTTDGVANGKIDELALPKPIRDFLAFRESSFGASAVQ